jgi:Fe-S-cluster containining protein
MLESLDVFRIARHFQMESAEVVEMYSEVRTVAFGAPILMLKTKGADQSCVFLDSGKCSIQECKPRTCKLYPLSVGPDDDLVNRIILKSPERQFHYAGKAHRASDWVDTNMDAEASEYVTTECKLFEELGGLLRDIPREQEENVIVQMMAFRYFMFNTNEDFMPQYKSNMELLKQHLEQMA